MQKVKLPSGDPNKETTEMGSLYFDTEEMRLVRLSDAENWEQYRVEIFTLNGSDYEEWSNEKLQEFVGRDSSEYLAGHCFDGHSPYGVWTNRASGHTCPECGKFMQTGFYHTTGSGRTAGGFYPGLICTDHHGNSGHCNGHMEFTEVNSKGIYLTATEYLKYRTDN